MTRSAPAPAAGGSSAPRARTAPESLERAASILDRYGRTETAELARRRFADTSRRRTVVVLGEIKRGKSSLVNALLGRRDLLPVDVEPASALPARVRAFPPASTGAHAAPDTEGNPDTDGDPDTADLEIDFPTGPRPAPRDELHRWARFADVTLPDPDQLPTGVTVTVGDSPLGDVVLVDTPGSGGLDDSAVRMALDEASRAGVLVMVCEASTPITEGEMDILDRARGEVGHVVVAVTKTDKNLRRWRAVVDDDRRLIERHLGERPTVVGVSSLRALDAAEPGIDPERRAYVERVSGLADLRAAIAHGLSFGDALPRLAGLRTARTAIAGLVEEVEADLRVAQEADAIVPELEKRRSELEALRSHSMQWEQYLSRNLALARTHVATHVDRELDEIRDRWTTTINRSGMKVLRSRPQIFTARIESEFRGVVERATTEILRALEKETSRLFPDDPAVWAQVAEPVMRAIVPPDVSGKAVTRKTENLFDPAMLSMGMAGASLAGAVTAIASSVVLLPVAGGIWVAVNLAYRAMKNGKTSLLAWLRETAGTTRTATMRVIDTVSTTARPEILIRYRDRLRRESESVQKRIDEAKAMARRDREEREAHVTRLTKNARILRATLAELDAHVAAIEARR